MNLQEFWEQAKKQFIYVAFRKDIVEPKCLQCAYFRQFEKGRPEFSPFSKPTNIKQWFPFFALSCNGWAQTTNAEPGYPNPPKNCFLP